MTFFALNSIFTSVRTWVAVDAPVVYWMMRIATEVGCNGEEHVASVFRVASAFVLQSCVSAFVLQNCQSRGGREGFPVPACKGGKWRSRIFYLRDSEYGIPVFKCTVGTVNIKPSRTLESHRI